VIPKEPLPRLCALTDLTASGARDHATLAVRLFAAGVRWVQIREKRLPDRVLAEDLRRAAASAPPGGLVLANDRPDLALVAGASGVHLGDRDLPPEAARRLLGDTAVIGLSTHAAADAIAAFVRPVDYVAIGPIFESPTKAGVRAALGVEEIARARARVARPIVAIGGITPERAGDVLAAGADAIAVISGLWHGRLEDRVAAFEKALGGL